MKQMTQASLFCGAGGLDIGFERAGFKTVWANDFNKDACDTFRRWSDAIVVCGDIGKISEDDIPDTDIILGGFPCQGFPCRVLVNWMIVAILCISTMCVLSRRSVRWHLSERM